MPRRSAASWSVLSPSGAPSRLSPPPDLGELERLQFIDIVTAKPGGFFERADLPLLSAYCRAVVAEQAAAWELARAPVVDGKPSPWLTVHQAAVKSMMGLSMRLRLSPQSRAVNNPSRPAPVVSYYDRAALEAHRDDPQ